MRRAFTGSLSACLLLASTVGTVVAQDEDLRMGDDPAYFERVEVADAGIAVAFPADWDVEIEMDYAEMEEGEPETGYWNVLYARGPEDAWCDLTWYLAALGDLSGLADHMAENFKASRGEGSTVQVTPVELAVGESYRVDVQDPADSDYLSSFTFDSDGGRYNLNCMASVHDARDWMDIAATLEWLADGTENSTDTEPTVAVAGYDLEFSMLSDGIWGMALPTGWDVELQMEQKEFDLPPEYADAGSAFYTDVLYAASEWGDWCGVSIYEDDPMTLQDQAAWDEIRYAAGLGSDSVVELSSTQIGADLAYQLDISKAGQLQAFRSYLWDSGPMRYQLDCASSHGPNSAWPTIAASIVPLGATSEVQGVELPDASIALSLPADWAVVPQMEALSTWFPPPYEDLGEVNLWRLLQSSDDADEWCNVYAYEQMPMSLEEHAAWFESMVSSNTDYPATVSVEPVSLPIGDAIRLIETYEVGEVHVIYLFDIDGTREYLVCAAPTLPQDAWVSVAETIEPLDGDAAGDAPPGIPEDAVAWDEVEQFRAQVPVLDPEVDASLMSAWCDRALWIEYADGTFDERLSCQLTDDPVDPPEWQAAWPAEAVSQAGGACEWTSDFWQSYDGSEVWASSWSVEITPDGSVSAISTYAAELLDCSDG